MDNITIPECYGRMMPGPEMTENGNMLPGKVFNVERKVEGIGRGHTKLICSREEWLICRECKEFKSCRDYSLLKLQVMNLIPSSK